MQLRRRSIRPFRRRPASAATASDQDSPLHWMSSENAGTLLIVRELLTAPRRYGELLDALSGIGTNLLVNRLRDLEAADVVGRALAPAPQSARVYELTDRGCALRPTVDALQAWGEANSDS